MAASDRVHIVDVSLRDGLQNEAKFLSVQQRAELARGLVQAGVRRMEIGAFVREDRVPQMAGTYDLVQALKDLPAEIRTSVLVPNELGLQRAEQSGARELAVFASCSEKFSQANINCSIQESLERFRPVMARARKRRWPVRAYLSCCFGCPYEGDVDPRTSFGLSQKLLEMGCFEVSLGDTIGVASPRDVDRVLRSFKGRISFRKLAGHFHDTRGTAIANIAKSLEYGVRVFDASLGGLGGCPYAPGAAGNVALEDVVYFFQRMHLKCDLELKDLIPLHRKLAVWMGKLLPSKVAATF
ncbi:MAG: hydroxymethylglutaryl-CoA lyase [Bdellovibrio sp.]